MKRSKDTVNSEPAINEQFEKATRESTGITLMQDAIKGFLKFRRKKQMPLGLEHHDVQ